MVSFIDRHKSQYGVEPICKQLPIASSTYYAHKACEAHPDKLSARAQRDRSLKIEIKRVWEESFRAYGARKIWRQLHQEQMVVARCTVERLMKDMGILNERHGM